MSSSKKVVLRRFAITGLTPRWRTVPDGGDRNRSRDRHREPWAFEGGDRARRESADT